MKRAILFLAALCLAFSSACSSKTALPPYESLAVFTDALGNEISVIKSERVVALSGSFAQIWLLSGGKLTGTTEDAFKNIDDIPSDTASVGSLVSPSLEAIIALEPDFVILSADIGGHRALSEQIAAANIAAAYFSVESFEKYLDMLKICTEITRRPDLYEQNGLSLKNEIDWIIAKAQAKPAPKILLLRAGSGKVSARNSASMAGEMLSDMGAFNIADSETGLLENLSLEVIVKEDPDFIFVVTQGDSEEMAQEALKKTLLSNPAWSGLTAVKTGRYISLPKDLFHLKPNNRWAEAYELLWEILYA